MKTKNNVGRPRKGKEASVGCSIRLQPTDKKKLVRKFGSLQGAIDFLIALYEKHRRA